MERRTALRRRLRRFPLLAWPIAFAFALLLWGGAASAQTYALAAKPTRTHRHDAGAYWISRADCKSTDDIFSFTFTASPADQRPFQVWVSESSTCTAYTDRVGPAAVCKRIEVDPSTVSLKQFPVKILSSQIAQALTNVDENCNDTSGLTTSRKVNINFLFMATPEDTMPVVITSGTSAFPIDVQVDLLGPAPPGDIEVTTSEGALAVKLVNPPTSTTGVAGFHIYCDPPPDSLADSGSGCACANIGVTSDAGVDDAGTSADATAAELNPFGGSAGATGAGGFANPPPPGTGACGGGGTAGAGGCGGGGASGGGAGGGTSGGGAGGGGAGGAGGTGGSCTDSVITEETCHSCTFEDAAKTGADPPSAGYLCGTMAANGTQGTAAVLSNDKTYAVAVAAFDAIGNEGAVSIARCATPEPVSDFYEQYRAAGGKGGGGCSVQPWMRTNSLIAPLAAAMASLALVLRRRRRARRNARGGESS